MTSGLMLSLLVRAIVGEVELGGGAGLHADGGAVELLGAGHAGFLRHHEALAVIVIHRREIEAEIGLAQQGPGGVAGQDIDLARLQQGEALLRRRRHELGLARVAQHGGGDGAADIDVEPGEMALLIRHREAGEAGVHRAGDIALALHPVERRPGRGLAPAPGSSRPHRQPTSATACRCPPREMAGG